MRTIAIVNEKGGTGKTTTAVNLAAALGRIGRRVLLVDLDGQAASSRWYGVEDDNRLADAMLHGGGLEPIQGVADGVDLAPASGKLDSVAHDLRPTQGGQLRKVLAEVRDRYDYVLIDCPPSLGNRLIGNALLAADEALVPVEPSVLALDGLRILLTTLEDVRDGFDHPIELTGVVACRYETRTRLSKLVLAELNRALPGKVFGTVVRETVRMQECPASGASILEYAPGCHAAEDYMNLARELDGGGPAGQAELDADVRGDLAAQEDLSYEERLAVMDFRKAAAERFCKVPAAKAERPGAQQQGEPQDPSSAEQTVPAAQKGAEKLEISFDGQAKPTEQTAVPQPQEDYLAEMPELYEPAPDGPPAAGPDVDAGRRDMEHQLTSDAQAAAPSLDVQDGPGGIQVEPQGYSDDFDRADQTSKVLATLGVCMLVAAGLVGWYTLRPSQTTSTAAARLSLPAAPVVEQDEAIDPAGGIDETYDDPADPAAGTVDDEQDLARRTKWPDDRKPREELASTAEPKGSPLSREPPAGAQAEPPEAGASPSDYTVTCVVIGSTGGRAIINGTAVREGETIGSARVVRILPQTVEIQLGGTNYILGIEPPQAKSPPSQPDASAAQENGN